MAHNITNTKSDFSNSMNPAVRSRTSQEVIRAEESVPAPLMWSFMATAVVVFLMVFSGQLVGDAAGYCLLTVIVVGFMLFRTGKVNDGDDDL